MSDIVTDWKNISDELRKEVLKARKRGMNKAMTKIKNETRKLIKFKHSSDSKYSDSLKDAARVSKYRDSSLVGEAIAGVHVMGIRKKGSGTFRTRFFEMGTDERHIPTHKRKNRKNGGYSTVQGHSTGAIKPARGFFKSAVNSHINEAPNIIEQELQKAIDKCNNG